MLSVRARAALAVAVSSFAFASLASATTIHFAGSSAVSASKTFTEGGYSVTATAYESTALDPADVFFGDSKPVTQTSNGLGVDGTGLGIIGDPSGEVDGLGVNEFLKLTFTSAVALTGAEIRNVDTAGIFRNSDGVRVYNEAGSFLDFFPLTTNPASITFTQPFEGTIFRFTALGRTPLAEASDYSLFSVNVAPTAPTGGPLPAPTPTAAAAGLTLLSTIGFARRRRQA